MITSRSTRPGVDGRGRDRRPGAAQPVDHPVVRRLQRPAAHARRRAEPDVVRLRGVGVRHGRAVDPPPGAPGLVAARPRASAGTSRCIDARQPPAAAAALAVHARAALEHDPLLRTFDGAIDDVSEHIAHGNTLVYDELAPLFVAFLERLRGRRRRLRHRRRRRRRCWRRAGAGPVAAGRAAGVPAGTGRAARRARRHGRRAFAVLAGNVLAVAHEQQRLQADVAAPMDAGLVTAARSSTS